jgi:hypothetical protein
MAGIETKENVCVLVRVMEMNRNQDAIVHYLTDEVWRNDTPKSGLISPFSLL